MLSGNTRKLAGIPKMCDLSSGQSPTNSNFVSAFTLSDTLSDPEEHGIVQAHGHMSSSYSWEFLRIHNKRKYNIYWELRGKLRWGLRDNSKLWNEYRKQEEFDNAVCETLKEVFLSKYKKRGNNKSVLSEIEPIFSDPLMQKICVKLLNNEVIVLRDGIGKCLNPKVHKGEEEFETGEVLYEEINVRCVIVDKEIQGYFEDLISAINSGMAKSIAWFNREEMENFVEQWDNKIKMEDLIKPLGYSVCGKAETLQDSYFLDEFKRKFRDRLPFVISKDFSGRVSVEKDLLYSYSPVLLKNGTEIPGEVVGKTYYVPIQGYSTGYLEKELQLKTYRRSVEYFHLYEQIFKASGITIDSSMDESENILMSTQSQGSSIAIQVPASSQDGKNRKFSYGLLLLPFLAGVITFSIILAITSDILLSVFCGSIAGMAVLFFNKPPGTELDDQHVKPVLLRSSGTIEV